jgi:hypothetical protein
VNAARVTGNRNGRAHRAGETVPGCYASGVTARKLRSLLRRLREIDELKIYMFKGDLLSFDESATATA